MVRGSLRHLWRLGLTIALSAACISLTIPTKAAEAPGGRLWVSRYDGPAGDRDSAASVAVRPDGSMVFITGVSTGIGGFWDYATIAYDPATGAPIWLRRYNGPGNDADSARAIVVSPNGSRVFVTGWSTGNGTMEDYATIAYDGATGAPIWLRRYDGRAHENDAAGSIVVNPSGTIAVVTGSSAGADTFDDWTTIAYDAETGAPLWKQRYNGQANNYDQPSAMAMSPDGSTVFVTGYTYRSVTADYLTIAYDVATGAVRWHRAYNGSGNGVDAANSVAVSSDGSTVYVTGYSEGAGGSDDYLTIAYDATSGVPRWLRRYDGPASDLDQADCVTVDPTGSRVFVTGFSKGSGGRYDYATIAYDSLTGADVWTATYNGPANRDDYASTDVVSPEGSTVYVVGYSYGSAGTADYATVAYAAATGDQVWTDRYDGPSNGNDYGYTVAVAPDGSGVFVTGESEGVGTSGDYATIAYEP